jgi:DNA-binding response OmpR family regulator
MSSVLVIDDEPEIASLVTRVLTAHGLDAEAATDPVRGRALAIGGDHDLVLLDLTMPGVSGLGVLRAATEAHPQRPVMILSATGDVDAKVRCLELGAADYMTKPFAVAELVARAWAHLRYARAAADRPGTLALDGERRTADAGDGPVELSEGEFRLVRHLVRHAGAISSREELLREVWDLDFDPGTNVVDVAVSRVRAKLGADVLQTVRGRGYRVAPAAPVRPPDRLYTGRPPGRGAAW